MNVIDNQQALVYDLPRAGPRNFDKFFMKNYFAPKLAEFNYASAAVADIYRLPLDEITALEIVGENTSEVIINVETYQGSFTIQPNYIPCQTLFTYYLFKQLRMHTADTRVIAYHEKDYKYIVWKIEQFTFTDLTFQTRILSVLNKPFWTIRSYTPVLSLARIQGENTKECLNPMFPRGRHRLIQLGFLSSVDMLLNNPNRIRVFAKLPGDARNINFSIEGSRGVPLSSEDIKEGTKKMDFGDLLINSSTINTPDKLKDQKSMEEFTAHIIEVETFVEFCCLALRVPQP